MFVLDYSIWSSNEMNRLVSIPCPNLNALNVALAEAAAKLGAWGFQIREEQGACPSCGHPACDEESLDNFRHLNADPNTCHCCLRQLAETHDHGKYQGGG